MASRISVEITGSSSELQAAVDKASASLKGLGDTLAKQVDKSTSLGSESVKSNDRVAASYGKVAEAAKVSGGEQAAAAKTSADATVAASKRSGDAMAAQGDRAAAAAAKSKAAWGSADAGITKSGKLILLAAAGVAVGSIDMASKFQAATTRLNTQAGASVKQVAALRKGMLDMAGDVGFAPDQLAAGMYHVVSSMNAVLPRAQRVSDELHVLKVAAEGAQIGGSNLEDTTYALASALNALHDNGQDAGKIMGQLNAIVGAGDMTMTDLLDSMKSGLIPAARSAGLSLQSLGAALAVMGDMGQRGALAGTRLRMSIALLSSPSEAAAKVLDTLGMKSKEATSTSEAMSKALQDAGLRTTSLSADLRKPDGIVVALRDLNDHLRESGLTATGAAAVMNKAFGGGKMGATIVELEQNTGRLQTKFEQIGKTGASFSGDWAATTHTFRFELDAAVASVEALGVKLGTVLLPYATQALHGLEGVAHWLGENKRVLDLLGAAVITFSTVAIGSYFYSKLKGAALLIKSFGSDLSTLMGKLGGLGSSVSRQVTGSGGAASTAGTLEAASMGVWGAKGKDAPGSIANPIVVAIIAGEYAGLGSLGAAGTVSTEQKVAQAETGAVESTGARVGTAAATGGAEEAAVSAGLLGTVKSGIGSLLKGGLIAGAGVGVAQAAGSAIGGSAGKTVSNVGSGAAIGAGIGSIIEPGIGTAIGAALGGVGGEIRQLLSGGSSFGKQVTGNETKGFQADNSDITKLLDAAAALNHPESTRVATRHDQAGVPGAASTTTTRLPGIESAAQKAQADADQMKAGQDMAKALEAGWSQYKFQSEPVMFEQFKAETAGLPPVAQAAALKSAISFSNGLEQNGRLVQGSTKQLISDVENQFPGLSASLGVQAGASVRTFTAALDFSQAEQNTKSTMTKIGNDFSSVQLAMTQTQGSVTQKSGAMIQALQGIVTNGTAPMRQQATADISALRDSTLQSFNKMGTQVASSIGDMKSAIVSGVGSAQQSADADFSAMVTAIQKAMAAGVLSTSQGTAEIGKQVNAALKSLGEPSITFASVAASPGAGGASAKTLTGVGKAVGGFIGQPGMRGGDNVPVNLGLGEAVLNDTQQAVANRWMAPIGGLPGLFNATAGSRHGMAAGGYVNPFGGPVNPERIDQGVDYSMAPGTPLKAIGAGQMMGVSYGTFNGEDYMWYRLDSGPDAGAYVYLAEQIVPKVTSGPVTAGETIATYASSGTGLETGFSTAGGQTLAKVTGGYTEGQLTAAGAAFSALMASVGAPAGLQNGRSTVGRLSGPLAALSGLGSAFGNGAPGAAPIAWPTITAPKVTGGGAVGMIAQGALTKIAAAANAFGQAKAGSATGSGSGALPGGLHGSVPRQIFQAFSALGWNKTAIAGAIGNAVQESSLDPSAFGGGAAGLWQWTPPSGLLDFAASEHQPWQSVAVQAQLVNKTVGGAAFNSAGSPAAAATEFMNVFEKPGIPELQHRIDGANAAFAQGLATGGEVGVPQNKLIYANKPTAQQTQTTKLAGLQKLFAQLTGYENNLDTLIGSSAAGSAGGQYGALSSRFSVLEGSPSFLNSDGSTTQAGYTQKINDDQTLIGILQHAMSDYSAELPLANQGLKQWLGPNSTLSSSIAKDQAVVAKNQGKILANKAEETSIRQNITDLGKPGKKTAQKLVAKLQTDMTHYGAIVAAAVAKEKAYKGKNKQTKASLAAGVLTAEEVEAAVLGPDKTALAAAEVADNKQAQAVRIEVQNLRNKLGSLQQNDTQLAKQDSSVGSLVSQLQSVLAGKGGDPSSGPEATSISLLEQVGGNLGTIQWGSGGAFRGIDTTYGAGYTTMTEILGLQNDIGTTEAAASASTTAASAADDSTLISLLQQQNQNLAAALAIDESQTSVLQGLIPEIPQFAKGGPVLADGLAYVHAGEHVVPQGGTLVSNGTGGQEIHLHQHFHGKAGELMGMIDQRIAHPSNVRVVSQQLGRRTSQLRGAPGGFR